jgi:hypothetical protein
MSYLGKLIKRIIKPKANMITCPLCNELVELMNYEPIILDSNGMRIDKPVHLHDYEVDDFQCPTRVLLSEDDFISWSHYERKTLQGYWTEYTTIILPFIINWVSVGRIKVYKVHYNKDNIRIKRDLIFEDSDVKLEDLPKVYQRFNNLKVFS